MRIELEVPEHVRHVCVGRNFDQVGPAVSIVVRDRRGRPHGGAGSRSASLNEGEAARPHGRRTAQPKHSNEGCQHLDL